MVYMCNYIHVSVGEAIKMYFNLTFCFAQYVNIFKTIATLHEITIVVIPAILLCHR